jgi:hypothetical protein
VITTSEIAELSKSERCDQQARGKEHEVKMFKFNGKKAITRRKPHRC